MINLTLSLYIFRWHLHSAMGKPLLNYLHHRVVCVVTSIVTQLSANLLMGTDVSIDATSYGWERIGSVLFPDKCLSNMPHEYYVTCGCSGCTINCGCRSMETLCAEYCKCGESCKNIP